MLILDLRKSTVPTRHYTVPINVYALCPDSSVPMPGSGRVLPAYSPALHSTAYLSALLDKTV